MFEFAWKTVVKDVPKLNFFNFEGLLDSHLHKLISYFTAFEWHVLVDRPWLSSTIF